MNFSNSNRFMVILCCCALVVFIYIFFQPKCVEKVDPYNYWLLEKLNMKEKNESENVTNRYLHNPLLRIQQRGEYWVFYNLLTSKRTFAQFESITYTTHGDFTFLDNLPPLLERWRGPIGVALYAPGDDFKSSVDSIHYLRDCTTYLIEEYVTFHVFFKGEHHPKEIPNLNEVFSSAYNCSIDPSFKTINSEKTYKALNNLTYPVNVARNIAKESSQTYFVLASDIELYPSLNIIENFLEMINKSQIIFSNKNPMVFPLNLFEVEKDANIPGTKTELLIMLKDKKAINFHQYVCAACHNTPKYSEWIDTKETEGLNVFHVGKRFGPFAKWEPIYIGTKDDPIYDERLSWEGKSDKMTQVC
nr:beta-1,4-glucuronyltransferase 1-like isoform X2 [Onthophagus taurus]